LDNVESRRSCTSFPEGLKLDDGLGMAFKQLVQANVLVVPREDMFGGDQEPLSIHVKYESRVWGELTFFWLKWHVHAN
jgi:hypothetical protein